MFKILPSVNSFRSCGDKGDLDTWLNFLLFSLTGTQTSGFPGGTPPNPCFEVSLFRSFKRKDQHLSCKAWLCAQRTFAMNLATSALPIKVIFSLPGPEPACLLQLITGNFLPKPEDSVNSKLNCCSLVSFSLMYMAYVQNSQAT